MILILISIFVNDYNTVGMIGSWLRPMKRVIG